MKLKLSLIALASLVMAGCTTTPTASNYSQYMNDPQVQGGGSGDASAQIVNKAAWNNVQATQMTSVRRMPDGSYSTDPSAGVLTVRAVILNSGTQPAQGNWRCRFFDSNNMPLYETKSNQQAKTPTGLGWHSMVVYPVASKSQTDDANVINCQAADSKAVNYRIEFHDTENDITVYSK
ncbi:MAG: hypothetical protein K5Q00_00740 [Gammaproteobacteria bacterium]|nr:hypothetical protein [Gammaproteobacteria bacterium]